MRGAEYAPSPQSVAAQTHHAGRFNSPQVAVGHGCVYRARPSATFISSHQASSFLTTSPLTSVRRKSRPWDL